MNDDFIDIDFLLESIQDHVVITNNKGIIQYVNTSFLVSSGYSEDEVIGRSMNILKSGFHSDKFYKNLWDSISRGEKFHATFKNKRKDGSFFWVRKTISPINKKGTIDGYLSISSDITGYKAFENKLKEEAEFHNIVIDSSQALIVVTDKMGNIISVNKSVLKITGYEKADIVGEHIDVLINSEIKPCINKFLINENTLKEFENAFISPINNKFNAINLIRWSVSKILNDDGSIRYLVGNGVDITNEAKYRSELNELNAELQSLVYKRTNELESANNNLKQTNNTLEEAQRIAKIGNWDWDILTNDLYWSDEIYRIFELNKGDFIPTYPKFLERVHPDDVRIVTSGVDLALKRQKYYDVEHRVITPSGELKHVRERGEVYFTSEDVPYRMLGTVQNITDKKNIEIKLKENELRLEEAQDLSKLGSWEIDVKNDTLVWSKEMFRIFEYEKSTPPPYSEILKQIHPDDLHLVLNVDNNISSIKKFSDIEHRIVTYSGKIKYVRSQGKHRVDVKTGSDFIFGTIQDITEKKLYEIRLAQSHQILENSLNSIIVADIDGHVIYTNKAAAKLWGFNNPEEMVKQWSHITDYWNSDEKGRFKSIINGILESGSIQLVNDIVRRRKDGSLFTPMTNVTVIKDENNKPIAISSSSFDISEKLKIEKELSKYDERLKFIFTNTDEIIFAIEGFDNNISKHKIIFLSDSVIRVLGLSHNEILNDSFSLKNYINQKDVDHFKERIADMFLYKKPVTCLSQFRNKSDENIWVETRLLPNLNSEGKIISYYGFSINVTEKLLKEETLKKSEMRYRSLYENSSVGMFKNSALTGKTLDANEVCIKLFGYPSYKDFIENFNVINHYVDLESRNKFLTELKTKGFIEGFEAQFKKLNGEMFWVQSSAKLDEEKMETEGVLVDITKRIEFEEQLINTINEKELLLKELHHRVKNNLQIVSGLLVLQVNRIADPLILAPLIESRDRIQTISLVHEKLYQTNSLSHIVFKNYLAELASYLKQTYADKLADIQIVVPDLFLNIETAIPLGLIFHELISNSFKHGFSSSHESKININIEELDDNKLNVIYTDNGLGFNTQDIETTNSLGLRLIRGLAKELGGSINIESYPEHGIYVSFIAIGKGG